MVKRKKAREKKSEVSSETLLIALVAVLAVMVVCFGGDLLYLNIDRSLKTKTTKESTPQETIPASRELINYLKFVDKYDNNRDVVYDAEERETNRFPFINISDDNIDMINSEIRDLAYNKVNEGSSIIYEYGIYDRYLSVSLIENNGVCVKVFKTYLIDLTTNELVSGEEIINELDENTKYELFLRVREIVGSEFENELRQEDAHDNLRNASLENIYKYNLSALDNELYLIVNIESSSLCTKSLRINLDNFSYSYFVM